MHTWALRAGQGGTFLRPSMKKADRKGRKLKMFALQGI